MEIEQIRALRDAVIPREIKEETFLECFEWLVRNHNLTDLFLLPEEGLKSRQDVVVREEGFRTLNNRGGSAKSKLMAKFLLCFVDWSLAKAWLDEVPRISEFVAMNSQLNDENRKYVAELLKNQIQW